MRTTTRHLRGMAAIIAGLLWLSACGAGPADGPASSDADDGATAEATAQEAAAPETAAGQATYAQAQPDLDTCVPFTPAGTAVHVDADAPAGGDGSASQPLRSISAALEQAGDGGSVLVAAGQYAETVRVEGVAATLVGGFAGGGDYSCSAPGVNETRIEAQGGDSVVLLLTSPAARVEGFHLTGGTGHVEEFTRGGGGLICVDSTATIARNMITDNISTGPDLEALGGGIYLQNCDTDVAGNVISGNTSDRGGAIAVNGGAVRITDNLVDANRGMSDHGGGIYAAASDIQIARNLVQGNVVGEELGYGWGGGVVVFGEGSAALLEGNVFRDNSAPSIGSGVYVDDGATATLRNELVVDNRCATSGGAGVYVDGLGELGSTVTIEHTTIASHDCPAEIGGNALFVERNSRVDVVNSILWGNGPDDVYTDDTSQVAVRYSDSQEVLAGEGNLNADPLFADPDAGDYHLRSTAGRPVEDGSLVIDAQHSPGIDAGDPSTPFAAEPEPNGGRVDLGAYGASPQASRSAQGSAAGLSDGARFDRGGDVDPVAQAIGTSQRLFAAGTAGRVVLATADRFPDALAGAALAGDDGPILLTSGLEGLDERVAAEIARVTGGDGVVLVLGGTAAISDQAAADAAAAAGGRPCATPFPTSCRYAGAGREHTAALVSESVIAEHPGAVALVARGDEFADAITGGAYAAAAGVPILLTPPNSVNESTREFLVSRSIHEVVVLGGTAAVDEATFQALPGAMKRRVAGAERTETAVRVAQQLWAPAGLGSGGWILVNVRGPRSWQTALSAAVAAARYDAPQLGVETPPAGLSPATLAHLGTSSGPIEAFGGPGLVSDEQLQQALAARGAPREIWRPSPGLTWQWQLSDYPVDTTIEADVYDIDGQLSDQQIVAELQALGRRVICYISAGSWEDFRPDAGDFPDTVIGEPLDPPFEEERWLDISRLDVLRPLMAARVADCAADGFDAVEFDNADGYTNDTGFPLTAADQLAYNRMLADLAHDAAMAAVLKNDLDQAEALEPDFEVLLLEQCVEFDECEAARPFLDADKLVLDAEYAVGPEEACPITQPLGIATIFKDIELDAPVERCP